MRLPSSAECFLGITDMCREQWEPLQGWGIRAGKVPEERKEGRQSWSKVAGASLVQEASARWDSRRDCPQGQQVH